MTNFVELLNSFTEEQEEDFFSLVRSLAYSRKTLPELSDWIKRRVAKEYQKPLLVKVNEVRDLNYGAWA